MADDQQKQAEEKKSKEGEGTATSTDQPLSEQGEDGQKAQAMTSVTPSEPVLSVSKDASLAGENGGTEPTKPKKAAKPVSVNLEKIIEQIEKLSVLELADLVHALEDRFGVSAQAPLAVAQAAASPSAGEPQEEKTTFNVILTGSGANKIAVIKAVRELVQTLGLKEAKDLVEAAPKPVLESVNKTTAEEAKTKLTAAGGTVELQ